MIEKNTLEFLRELAFNNNREWFHANKVRYDKAKQNVLDVTNILTIEIGKFDSAIRPFDPRKGMFRIARDTRFTTNKEPYKHNFGTCINPVGRNICSCSTYYLNIEPNNCFASAGIYMPDKKSLQDIRYHIYNNFDSFNKIISNKEFVKLTGGMFIDPKALKRVPDCFDKAHPSAEYMKFKSYFAFVDIEDNIMTDKQIFLPEILKIFKVLQPLNTYINGAFNKFA